jgi:AcrR family transcriptional regulator
LLARPISEEKREAILASAAELVATMGIGAPTMKIAKGAGVAEGTLFTYFVSKDELLNQLYLDIKASLGGAILDGYPSGGSLRERSLHVWSRFVDWGAAHPVQRRAMRQLAVSDRITEVTKVKGSMAFHDINAMIEKSLREGLLKKLSPAFVGATLEAVADTTLDFIAREPAKAAAYKIAGFEVFWNGVAR